MESRILPQLLLNSAERFPNRRAIIFQDTAMSYAELDETSNRLAHALKRHGVKPGDRVGIFLNKSTHSYVSLFGILKADAVYVPLDPWAPVKRLAFMVENCDIKVLISASSKRSQIDEILAEKTALERIFLADDCDDNLNHSTQVV
ncbi:AMP-binding protein, partial [bacterium]|nr:AMP-binding protein [bacterium]